MSLWMNEHGEFVDNSMPKLMKLKPCDPRNLRVKEPTFKPKYEDRACLECGKAFTPRVNNQTFCSRKCGDRHRRRDVARRKGESR